MSIGTFSFPLPQNEPVLSYTPGSKERKVLEATLKKLKSEVADIPMYIGGKEIRTNKKIALHPPHEIKHVLGHFHSGNEKTCPTGYRCCAHGTHRMGRDELGKTGPIFF
jgi:1-pyrroline-5-carboxylate dehydrogenase